MATATERRKHDLLWATCIVAGFAVLFGLVVIVRQDKVARDENARLLSEANQAIAEGDLACSDQYLNYDRARRAYVRAVDLLRSAGAGFDAERARVRLKIARVSVEQQDYRQAKEDIDVLRHHYPAFSPDEVTALYREVIAGLNGQPVAPPQPQTVP